MDTPLAAAVKAATLAAEMAEWNAEQIAERARRRMFLELAPRNAEEELRAKRRHYQNTHRIKEARIIAARLRARVKELEAAAAVDPLA